MGLEQVDTFTVTSSIANFKLGAGSDGSSGNNFAINTDDVYMVTCLGVTGATDTQAMRVRVTKSGSAQADSNYDGAHKSLFSDASFGIGYYSNQTTTFFSSAIGNATGENGNFILYLYNFNSSSEYSFVTTEESSFAGNVNNLRGRLGGFIHTVASASDGLQFYMNSGNITGGTWTLYKVV